jgi:5-methylthioadenosine/S-adenosylhomocysteine deaminase
LSSDVRLLENGFVLTLDEIGTAGWLSIAVEREQIAAVGPEDALRARFPAAQRIDCTNCVLMPGLINAHLHPEAQVLKGLVEELDLHDWADARRLNQALALLGNPEFRTVQRAAVRAALADALLMGTTCIATYAVTRAADEVAADALREFGIPGHVTIRDPAFLPVCSGPAHTMLPPRMYRLHAEEALTAEELTAATAAHARGERIVMHAAETAQRVQLMRTRFGYSTIRLLEANGLLSPSMLLSHAVHVDQEECALLAARGAVIIASPTAELKLADGIAPVVDYLARGITVAIGTDSAICNNGNDMFIECRILGLAQKTRYGAHALNAMQILQCATVHGARALGEAHLRGTISTGLAADIIVVNAANPRLQPLVHNDGYSNVAANLVYAATGQDVRDVMIGGRWVVRDSQLLVARADVLWAELAEAAAYLYRSMDTA